MNTGEQQGGEEQIGIQPITQVTPGTQCFPMQATPAAYVKTDQEFQYNESSAQEPHDWEQDINYNYVYHTL